MYSQRIINRDVDRWLAHPSNHGQSLDPVSRLEFARAVSHFDSLVEPDPETGRLIPRRKVTPDGRQVFNSSTGVALLGWKETLTEEERRWLRTQRVLCA